MRKCVKIREGKRKDTKIVFFICLKFYLCTYVHIIQYIFHTIETLIIFKHTTYHLSYIHYIFEYSVGYIHTYIHRTNII